MGLLDQVLGGAGAQSRKSKPGLGSTVAAGVVLALLVKAVRHYEATHDLGPHQGRSFDPPRTPQASPPAARSGGLGGILGGLAGGGLGGLLSQFGGAGALSELVSKLQKGGLGQVGSWVGPGENQPVAPQQLADALGPDTVEELQAQTGIPREALLTELAQELPEAVNTATPAGRLPTDDELHDIATGKPTGAN